MTEAKHTPGPWSVEEYGDDETPALVIHKGSESRVCFMATPGSHGDPEKIEADAHLISAAPELYEALCWIEKHYANQDMSHAQFRIEAFGRALAALAKASAPSQIGR